MTRPPAPVRTTTRTLVAFLVLTSSANPNGRAVPVHLALPPGVLAPGAYEMQLTVLAPDAARAAFRRATVLIVP